jgi:simple sugar transport system ATP-binding protein
MEIKVGASHPVRDITVTVDVVWVDERESELRRRACDVRAAAVGPVSAPDDVVRVEHVAKRFGEVVALRDVSLHLRRGEALGLVGDNASGKSTLIKIIAGFHRPDLGRLFVHGAPVELRSVDHARSLGIECVYQDLALVDELSVWQNMFLRRETVHRPLPFLARRSMRARAWTALDDLGIRVASVDLPVGRLSGGQRQAIAVARGVRLGAQVLLLDEPIAAMGTREGAAMLDVLARLRQQSSVSMILVAHNMAHVLRLCDRINLIEDGGIALDEPTSQTSVEQLANRMMASVGRADAPGPAPSRAAFTHGGVALAPPPATPARTPKEHRVPPVPRAVREGRSVQPLARARPRATKDTRR